MCSGADPNQKNEKTGDYPLHIACRKVLQNDNKNQRREVITNVQLLLTYKADPNIQDIKGETPLVIAAKLKCIETVRLLLKEGADPRIKDKNGNSPLDVSGEFHITKFLEDFNPAVKSWKWQVENKDFTIFENEIIGEGTHGMSQTYY